jgi:pilus assembly protein CpaE
MTSGDLDPDKLAGYVAVHPSGVHVVPAPVRPEDAELVAEDRVAHLLEIAKEAYDVVVVDTAAHFHASTLATLDRTDKLVVAASLDIPSVKNVTLTLQTLNLLHYPHDRVNVVVNRVQPRAEIERGEVERALGLKVVAEVPYDRDVPVAVNRGVPVPMSAPRSPVTKAIGDLADRLVPEKGKKGAKGKDEVVEAAKGRGGSPRFKLNRKAA